MAKRPAKTRGTEKFEEFDPTQGEQFEEFDVAGEAEAETEAVLESLSGLTDSEDELQSLMAARDEIEDRFMKPAGAQATAVSAEEPHDPGNVAAWGLANAP